MANLEESSEHSNLHTLALDNMLLCRFIVLFVRAGFNHPILHRPLVRMPLQNLIGSVYQGYRFQN